MSKNILDKKIPSIGGLGILVVGLIVTTLLVKGPNSFQVRANPASDPKDVQITNISDSSFTVTYVTDDSVVGTIKYGEDPKNLDNIALDEKDILSQDINEYKTHSISVDNLTPNTEYYFTITSGDKTVKNNNEPFEIKTGPIINTSSSTQIPITGKIIDPNNKPITEGLIIVTIEGAQEISGTIKENGEYIVPLNNLRTADLINYYLLNDKSNINLYINSNNLNSEVKLSLNQVSPVPTITLSKNYNFLNSKTETSNNLKSRDVRFPEFESGTEEPDITPEPTPQSL